MTCLGFAQLPVYLAVVGRPNVGKSTLVNTITEMNRVVTGPMPGLTRDSTEVRWSYEGKDIVLVDTAGMRRWAAVSSFFSSSVTSILHFQLLLPCAGYHL